MVTRLYLPSAGTAGAVPAPAGSWAALPDPVPYLPTGTAKTGTAQTEFATADTVGPAANGLLAVFVTAPVAAQTIAGTVRAAARCRQSSNDAEMRVQLVVRVVAADNTERGVLLPADDGPIADEFPTSGWYSRMYPKAAAATAVDPVAAAAGDRIVFEFGWRAHNTNTARVGRTYFGDGAASDLPYVKGDINVYNPWVELSHDLTFLTVDAPAGLTVTAGTGQLTAAWTNTPGAASHKLRWRPVGGPAWTTVDPAVSPHTVGGLTDGTPYEVQVAAVDTSGPSAWTASAAATPAVTGGTVAAGRVGSRFGAAPIVTAAAASAPPPAVRTLTAGGGVPAGLVRVWDGTGWRSGLVRVWDGVGWQTLPVR